MPRKTKSARAADKAALSQIPAELLEQLIPGPVSRRRSLKIFFRTSQGIRGARTGRGDEPASGVHGWPSQA